MSPMFETEGFQWLEFATTFQTAIAAGIGFIGVITTLAVNALLVRRQEQDRRKHDRQALVSGLRAELSIMHQFVDGAIKRWEEAASREREEDDSYRLWLPTWQHRGYAAYVSRMGLLPSKIVEQVAKAYLVFDQLPLVLQVIVEGEIPDDQPRSVRIAAIRLPQAIRVASGTRATLAEALNALDAVQ